MAAELALHLVQMQRGLPPYFLATRAVIKTAFNAYQCTKNGPPRRAATNMPLNQKLCWHLNYKLSKERMYDCVNYEVSI